MRGDRGKERGLCYMNQSEESSLFALQSVFKGITQCIATHSRQSFFL